MTTEGSYRFVVCGLGFVYSFEFWLDFLTVGFSSGCEELEQDGVSWDFYFKGEYGAIIPKPYPVDSGIANYFIAVGNLLDVFGCFDF